ncbi:hypothetical protein, partial [Sulfitobacter sp. EhC04]|uniref:hypothetical protein n=1 Tax=Sulfitobacter sp. EhC04 TaxID=1849168 RepID=UPI001F346B9A
MPNHMVRGPENSNFPAQILQRILVVRHSAGRSRRKIQIFRSKLFKEFGALKPLKLRFLLGGPAHD